MKLTKKQRLQAYQWAYGEGECSSFHVCGRLRRWIYDNLGYDDFRDYDELIEDVFPEFELFRPAPAEEWFEANGCSAWFEDSGTGKRERLTCLAFCIAMCQSK